MIKVDQQRTCGRVFAIERAARTCSMAVGQAIARQNARKGKNMARKKSLKKLLEEYECEGQMSLDDYDEGLLFDYENGELPFCDTPLTIRFTFVIRREVALHDLYGQESETQHS